MSGKFEWPSGFNTEINRLSKEKNRKGVEEGEYGTSSNPLNPDGTILDIAHRVRSGNWTTLDLHFLANYVIEKESHGQEAKQCR